MLIENEQTLTYLGDRITFAGYTLIEHLHPSPIYYISAIGQSHALPTRNVNPCGTFLFASQLIRDHPYR